VTKDNDLHKDADTWGRGRTDGNRDGAGAYTQSDKEALAQLKRGKLPGEGGGKIDRSDTPNKKPYGSGHYPAGRK
jgi:hypothetical protein